MNQANVTHSVSKIFYNLKPKRNLRNVDGPKGRLQKIAKTLTALFKYERIELNYNRADEVRGYVERLISEAIRHGPEHKQTMDYANFYILEKQLVHKLFKVLVPRYEDYSYNYTKMHKLPKKYVANDRSVFDRAVLELRGNIYPSLTMSTPSEHNLLHNILLREARKEYTSTKDKEMMNNIDENLSQKE